MSDTIPDGGARQVIVLTLPVCPSANALWITPRHHKSRIRSPAYNDWLHTAGWLAKTQLIGASMLACQFSARIEVPGHKRRDLDNWIKPLLDLCQWAGVIRNDSGLRDCWIIPAERDDVLVVLTDMGGAEQRDPKMYRVRHARSVRPTQAKLAAYRRAGMMV